jgi:hypothetical protein
MKVTAVVVLAVSAVPLAACSSSALVVGGAGAVPEERVFLTTSTPPSALEGAVEAVTRGAPPPLALQDEGAGTEVVSTARRVTSESDPVGPYDQPEWTTRRRFARTRVYVLPEGQIEVEQWWRGTFDRGERASHRFQAEIGVGLPGRFQFDLYGNYDHDDGTTNWVGLQPELRWAPADWGVIPLNPTLYVEYKWNHHENDVFEGKVLLGDEICRDWHWGMNLSVEQTLGGERDTELAVTQAISYTLADRQFSVGAEFEYDRVTAEGSRDDQEHEFYAGPSIQWRPNERMHVDLVPLKGWHDAHTWRVFLVVGWDFGGRVDDGPRSPVSSKSR